LICFLQHVEYDSTFGVSFSAASRRKVCERKEGGRDLKLARRTVIMCTVQSSLQCGASRSLLSTTTRRFLWQGRAGRKAINNSVHRYKSNIKHHDRLNGGTQIHHLGIWSLCQRLQKCQQDMGLRTLTFFSTIAILRLPDGPVFPKPINRGEELSQRDEEWHELAGAAHRMNA
jgi:hypothetical protein